MSLRKLGIKLGLPEGEDAKMDLRALLPPGLLSGLVLLPLLTSFPLKLTILWPACTRKTKSLQLISSMQMGRWTLLTHSAVSFTQAARPGTTHKREIVTSLHTCTQDNSLHLRNFGHRRSAFRLPQEQRMGSDFM